MENELIDFAQWIAKSQTGGMEDNEYQFTLIDGDYYFVEDEEGEQPLTAKDLYDMYTKSLKK